MEIPQSARVRYSGAFLYALKRTLAFEGGWSDHPDDRGGLTKWGITAITLSRYESTTGNDITLQELDQETAIDVYYELFWRAEGIGHLPMEIQEIMFDWTVHSGPFAIRSMQRELGVKPDGHVGPRTIRAAKDYVHTHKSLAQKRLAIRRMRALCRLVQKDRRQASFITGWWNRVSTFML